MTHRLSRAATARHPLTRVVRNTALQAAGRLRPVRHAFAMNLSELNTRSDDRARSVRDDMMSGRSGWLHRHAVSAGFVLMFAFTWPMTCGRPPTRTAGPGTDWPILPLLVGFGFVAASLVMTGILDGRAGIGRLLRQFLVWRIGLLWYAVVLLGAPIVDLAAIGVHVLLGGSVPDFTQPFARQVVGPLDLGIALPLFFLFGVFTNGEEIGGAATPRRGCRPTTLR